MLMAFTASGVFTTESKMNKMNETITNKKDAIKGKYGLDVNTTTNKKSSPSSY